MRRASLFVLVAVLAYFGSGTASAVITGVAGGTAAPAATLGPYTMTPFGVDSQATDVQVPSVASPLGGSVGFTPTLFHTTVGDQWSPPFSPGYDNGGDVYTAAGATTALLTLPAGTTAFYLYIEQNNVEVDTVTATSQDGTVVSQSIDSGVDADYFGFYGTGGDTIQSITIDVPADANGFAIGRFGIAPEPSAACLLSIGAFGMLSRRRRV